MKIKLYTIFTLLLFTAHAVFAQGIVNNGAQINIQSGTYLTISGGNFTNLTNAADGGIELDGIIQISGNFINNATGGNVFKNVNTNGEVIFNGTGTQTISGTGNFINFEKLTINAGSSTELVAGFAATTNGILTVNGTFFLKTPLDASPAGSLITNSAIAGTGDVKLERYFAVGNRWQYISVPISNQLSTPLIDTPYPGDVNPNFYTYNETFEGTDPSDSEYSNWDTFTGIWNRIGTGQTLTVGQGYIWNAYNASDLNITFTSSTPSDIFTGNFTTPVTYTNNDNANGYGNYYDGWNIVGNPYPSAISWDNITKSANMDNTIYYWDGINGNYVYYFSGTDGHLEGASQSINNTSTTTMIPAYQSFFVHLSSAADVSENFTINNTARLHSQQDMYKSGNNNNEINFEYIKLRTEKNGLFDETIIRFVENSNSLFEGKEDALKMTPMNPETPVIYSLTTQPIFPLAINTLPLNDFGTKVPLGFKTNTEGNYEIFVKELQTVQSSEVYMVDTKLNTKTLLNLNDTYSFYFDGGDSRNRFFLWFVTDQTTENQDISSSQINIWSGRDIIYIKIDDLTQSNSQVIIYNSLGQMLINKNINSTFNEIPMQFSEGFYFVKLITPDNKITNKKVFIKH